MHLWRPRIKEVGVGEGGGRCLKICHVFVDAIVFGWEVTKLVICYRCHKYMTPYAMNTEQTDENIYMQFLHLYNLKGVINSTTYLAHLRYFAKFGIIGTV